MTIFRAAGIEPKFKGSPLVMVDVGASGGVHGRWAEAAPWLRVIGFDADRRATAGGSAMTLLNAAVYRTKGPLTFYLTAKQETSSVFPVNRKFIDRFPEASRFDVVETTTLEADTLDAQLAAAGQRDVDFIKIDAQGCELAILEGGSDTVRQGVFGMELEAEFAEMYQGQPLFADIDAFMRREGFVLFDLRPYYWKRRTGMALGGPKGQMIFSDVLYLRELGSFAVLLKLLADDQARQLKVLRALAVCWLYGYLDYASEILSAFAALFTDAERRAIESALAQSPELSARMPDFPGRAKVAHLFDRLHQMFRRAHRGWGDAGPRLGNR